MNDPTRLRDGEGAARRLMAGAAMHVPSASRRRAVAFTSAAASLGASTVAVTASASSLIKGFVLCVALGAVGGGVVSLAASETIARLDTKVESAPGESQPRPVQRPVAAQVSPPSEPSVPPAAEVAAVAPPVVESPALTEPAKPASSKASGRDEAAPSLEAPAARPATGSSLFEEQRIVESARAAVARGDLGAASALLDNYERAYAAKQFWPEALALRIEALQGSGKPGQARSLAAEFARRYPHHPLLQRVQGVVAK